MEKLLKILGYTILAAGAAIMIYPAIGNFIINLDKNLPASFFHLLPIVTFFWAATKISELEQCKKTVAKLRKHINTTNKSLSKPNS